MHHIGEIPPEDDLFQLYLTTGWNKEYNLTASQFHQAVSASYCSRSCWDGDLLTGFGRVISDGLLHGMIYEMIVHPDYQNRGIGSQILKALLDKCRSDGILEMQLFCAEGKEQFYLKHGFVRRMKTAPGMGLVLQTESSSQFINTLMKD